MTMFTETIARAWRDISMIVFRKLRRDISMIGFRKLRRDISMIGFRNLVTSLLSAVSECHAMGVKYIINNISCNTF